MKPWLLSVRRLLLVTGLLTATTLAAELGTAPAEPPAPAANVRTLTLTLLDGTTQQPISGADVVTWEGRDVPPTKTDAKGVAVVKVPVGIAGEEFNQRFDVTVLDPRYAMRRVMWIATAGRVRETLPDAYTMTLSPGVGIGGVVRDEHGAPVSGVKVLLYGTEYRGFRLGGDTKSHQEFPEISVRETDAPVTDAAGKWHIEHFPTDLQRLTITLVRLGGAQTKYATANERSYTQERMGTLDLTAARGGTAELVLKDGHTFRGLVVDEAGKPIAGAQLRARDAKSRSQPYVFTTSADGSFELPHWETAKVLITAEGNGHQIRTVTIDAAVDAAPTQIVLGTPKPLRLRVVGENDAPVAETKIITDPNPSDQILNWAATTNGEGRAEWSSAPDSTVTLWITPSNGYPHRVAKFHADGTEQVIRLRKGEDKSIQLHFRVVDAATGEPIPRFDVLRRLPGASFNPWGAPGENGEFKNEMPLGDMPKGFVPGYRLQIRAAGHANWNSEQLEFFNGDQDITVKLSPGVSTASDEPPRRPGNGINGETNPELLALGSAVTHLLESGDIAAFEKATNATQEDWNRIIPFGTPPGEGPMQKNGSRVLKQRGQQIAASGERAVELAKRVGIGPGAMKFTLKSISSPMNGSTRYTIGGQQVSLPFAMAIRVVLAGEPINGDAKLRGEYQLSVGRSQQLPAGWRTEEGVRWVSFPATVGDDATRHELHLAALAASDDFAERSAVSESDDDALTAFGQTVADLVNTGAVPAFVTKATLSTDEMKRFVEKYHLGGAEEAAERQNEIVTSLTSALRSIVSARDGLGGDFSDAKIVVKRVVADRPDFTRFGEIDGLRVRSASVTLSVDTPRLAKSGHPLAGTYTVAVGEMARINGRWVIFEPKIRWQSFPTGLLSEAELKAIELENYVAEHDAFPPGATVPEIQFTRLSDQSTVALSAYRGKVVVLEFWATWCGPCQEPMEHLQHLRDAHPDWKERVEVIALSIDDKGSQATEHLAKRGWNQTTNVWAGEGGFGAAPAKAFRIRGVPTCYIIDRDGKVVKAGHPASLEFDDVIDAQLRGGSGK